MGTLVNVIRYDELAWGDNLIGGQMIIHIGGKDYPSNILSDSDKELAVLWKLFNPTGFAEYNTDFYVVQKPTHQTLQIVRNRSRGRVYFIIDMDKYDNPVLALTHAMETEFKRLKLEADPRLYQDSPEYAQERDRIQQELALVSDKFEKSYKSSEGDYKRWFENRDWEKQYYFTQAVAFLRTLSPLGVYFLLTSAKKMTKTVNIEMSNDEFDIYEFDYGKYWWAAFYLLIFQFFGYMPEQEITEGELVKILPSTEEDVMDLYIYANPYPNIEETLQFIFKRADLDGFPPMRNFFLEILSLILPYDFWAWMDNNRIFNVFESYVSYFLTDDSVLDDLVFRIEWRTDYEELVDDAAPLQITTDDIPIDFEVSARDQIVISETMEIAGRNPKFVPITDKEKARALDLTTNLNDPFLVENEIRIFYVLNEDSGKLKVKIDYPAKSIYVVVNFRKTSLKRFQSKLSQLVKKVKTGKISFDKSPDLRISEESTVIENLYKTHRASFQGDSAEWHRFRKNLPVTTSRNVLLKSSKKRLTSLFENLQQRASKLNENLEDRETGTFLLGYWVATLWLSVFKIFIFYPNYVTVTESGEQLSSLLVERNSSVVPKSEEKFDVIFVSNTKENGKLKKQLQTSRGLRDMLSYNDTVRKSLDLFLNLPLMKPEFPNMLLAFICNRNSLANFYQIYTFSSGTVKEMAPADCSDYYLELFQLAEMRSDELNLSVDNRRKLINFYFRTNDSINANLQDVEFIDNPPFNWSEHVTRFAFYQAVGTGDRLINVFRPQFFIEPAKFLLAFVNEQPAWRERDEGGEFVLAFYQKPISPLQQAFTYHPIALWLIYLWIYAFQIVGSVSNQERFGVNIENSVRISHFPDDSPDNTVYMLPVRAIADDVKILYTYLKERKIITPEILSQSLSHLFGKNLPYPNIMEKYVEDYLPQIEAKNFTQVLVFNLLMRQVDLKSREELPPQINRQFSLL